VAALAAAPAIVPSSVFARPAPSDRIALAAIGVGNRGAGNVWADFVETQDDVRLVAACDCFAGRRTDFAAKVNAFYGAKVCEPMADWREVLARKDVDGVIISTPDHRHVPIVCHAARAKNDGRVPGRERSAPDAKGEPSARHSPASLSTGECGGS
jgi:hypothetical protein